MDRRLTEDLVARCAAASGISSWGGRAHTGIDRNLRAAMATLLVEGMGFSKAEASEIMGMRRTTLYDDMRWFTLADPSAARHMRLLISVAYPLLAPAQKDGVARLAEKIPTGGSHAD